MGVFIAAVQVAAGGVGLTLLTMMFLMWRRGDLVPRAVVEMMEVARKEDKEQITLLMTAVIEALERMDSRPRHSRDQRYGMVAEQEEGAARSGPGHHSSFTTPRRPGS